MICLIVICVFLINQVSGQVPDLSTMPGYPRIPLGSLPPLPCPSKGTVCAVLNGVWKTFKNINEMSAEIAKGNREFSRKFFK